jgi:hypothetical protein
LLDGLEDMSVNGRKICLSYQTLENRIMLDGQSEALDSPMRETFVR